jgi:hypothetical protein
MGAPGKLNGRAGLEAADLERGSRDGLKRERLARVGDRKEGRVGVWLARLGTGTERVGDVLRLFEGVEDIVAAVMGGVWE